MLLLFFNSPGAGLLWTHSPAEQYLGTRAGGFALSLPSLYWSRQLQESLGSSPSQSFSVLCFTHFSVVSRDTPCDSRGMGGRKGKEKVALRWWDFSSLPYQPFVKGISWYLWPSPMSKPVCHLHSGGGILCKRPFIDWVSIAYRLERDQNISHWQSFK